MDGAGTVQGLGMVLCPWKARQEPTAAEGTTASFLCSLDLHPWCVGNGRQELLSWEAVSPGATARSACTVALPQFPQPVSTRADAVAAPSGGTAPRGDGCGGHEVAAVGCEC